MYHSECLLLFRPEFPPILLTFEKEKETLNDESSLLFLRVISFGATPLAESQQIGQDVNGLKIIWQANVRERPPDNGKTIFVVPAILLTSKAWTWPLLDFISLNRQKGWAVPPDVTSFFQYC